MAAMSFRLFMTFFHRFDPLLGLTNGEVYEIRRRVAQMFERAGFGAYEDEGNERFRNTYMIPETDEYFQPENELSLFFMLRHPTQQGDNAVLLLDQIPLFLDQLREDYPHIASHVRLLYMN